MESLKKEFNLGGEVSPSFLEILKTIVEFYGKDRVDVQRDDKYLSTVIIHYPKILISNSAGLKHIIRDFYVKLILSNDGFLEDMVMLKTTFTYDELAYGYTHSHIPKRKFLKMAADDASGVGYILSPTTFSEYKKGLGFCMGKNTPLVLTYKSVEFPDDPEKIRYTWMSFLLALDAALHWESDDGGPYARIKNIGSEVNISTSYTPHINMINSPKNDATLELINLLIPILAKSFLHKLKINEIPNDIIRNKINISVYNDYDNYFRIMLHIDPEFLKYFILKSLVELDLNYLIPFILYKNSYNLSTIYKTYAYEVNPIKTEATKLLTFKNNSIFLKVIGVEEIMSDSYVTDDIIQTIFKGLDISSHFINTLQLYINANFNYAYKS